MEVKKSDISKLKLIAFDLDGTLTQHRSMLEPSAHELLDRLAERYKLLIVGAGSCRRIFDQLSHYPIDIIGNYGLQYAEYDRTTRDISIVFEDTHKYDRESVTARVAEFRRKHGLSELYGDTVEFHNSGCITVALLGTDAPIAQKLTFDPDRTIRRALHDEFKALFPEYIVFIGGSSSFDMSPAPYDKYYALDTYCRQNGLEHENAVFVGDDFGHGGNDESVFHSDFGFIPVTDYRKTDKLLSFLLD